MSQKEKNFQSKTKKFAGKKSGGFGGGKKPAGKGFGKKFDRDGGDRDGFKSKRGFGDKKPYQRRERDGDDRPRRDFADRKPRRDGDEGGYKPKRSFGDKKPYQRRERDGEDRPRRDFADRKPRRDGDEGGYKPKRSFGDKKPYQRRERDGEDRPRRDFGDRKPRRFGDDEGGFKGKRDFGDKKPYQRRERDGDDRPRRDFADRKPRRDDRDGGFQSARPQKPFQRYGERDEGFKPKRGFADKKAPRRSRDADADFPPYQEASTETRKKLKSDRQGFGAPSSAFLYGHHAVRAALGNPDRVIQRLLVTENGMSNIQKAYDSALADGINLPEPLIVEKEDIDRLLPRDAVHQDVLLDCQPLAETYLVDILDGAPEDARILVLDQVTDPHNVGAILRSACAFGVYAVVAQKLHAPEITGTLAKIASGAVEHIPLLREVNLNRAIEQLKDAGFFCIGLDERGKQTIAEAAPKKGRVALVLGAEGDGLRRLVSENCDTLAQLPTEGPIASLNVSNAAAVALYELKRKG